MCEGKVREVAVVVGASHEHGGRQAIVCARFICGSGSSKNLRLQRLLSPAFRAGYLAVKGKKELATLTCKNTTLPTNQKKKKHHPSNDVELESESVNLPGVGVRVGEFRLARDGVGKFLGAGVGVEKF